MRKAVGRGLWVMTGVYWAALFVLTHTPRLPPPPGGMSDKGAHLIAYGGLAGALFVSMWASGMRGVWWKVIVICAAYGAVDEWVQALPWVGRMCELMDWFADMGGTLIAVTSLSAVRWAVSWRGGAAKMAA